MNTIPKNMLRLRSILVAIGLLLVLVGCGGRSSGGGAVNYTVGGTIAGLSGTVVLQNNLGNNITVSGNGTFTFPTQGTNNLYGLLTSSSAYDVSILTQPNSQTCSISNGAGTISGSNITGINISCMNYLYSVGGTISGLNGSVVLQNNNGDNLTVSNSGPFTFPTQIASGNTYSVSVLTPPSGELCSVSSGAGTVSGSNVSNVTVVCATALYSVGVTVSGLNGSVVLQNNNGDNLTASNSGSFTFSTQIAQGSPYNITVLTQPASGNCSVANGGGTATGNISNVSINCAANTYTIGGTVTGLNGGMMLQDNGGDTTNVFANGPFIFASAVAAGGPYSASVSTQPAGQNCSVLSGSGTVAASNVSSIAVSCRNVTSIIGGAKQGNPLSLNNAVSTVAGSGATGSTDNNAPLAATFNLPRGITSDGTNLYVADTLGNKIRQIVIASGAASAVGAVSTVAGSASGLSGFADDVSNDHGASALFSNPYGITTDGAFLYVADTLNNRIRKIDIATGVVTTVAGSGSQGFADDTLNDNGTTAKFNNPHGITNDGSNLYVADTLNNRIRKIEIATGNVTTLAGSATQGSTDNIGTQATFFQPWGITTDGGNLYVADTSNHLIRKIVIASGAVTTLAGTAGVSGSVNNTVKFPKGKFSSPRGITTDGTNLYVADSTNQLIRKIVIATGSVTTLAGTGTSGSTDSSTGTLASFYDPSGITTDGVSLYVADTSNKKVRAIK